MISVFFLLAGKAKQLKVFFRNLVSCMSGQSVIAWNRRQRNGVGGGATAAYVEYSDAFFIIVHFFFMLVNSLNY